VIENGKRLVTFDTLPDDKENVIKLEFDAERETRSQKGNSHDSTHDFRLGSDFDSVARIIVMKRYRVRSNVRLGAMRRNVRSKSSPNRLTRIDAAAKKVRPVTKRINETQQTKV
jgi:hypothetical protein